MSSKNSGYFGKIMLVEVNETIADNREVSFNHDKLNGNGGAPALGHSIGTRRTRFLSNFCMKCKSRG